MDKGGVSARKRKNEWGRDTVFGQSIIQVLDQAVQANELTDREATTLLRYFDDSFSEVLAQPPADGISYKERIQSIDATIQSRTRCQDYLMFELQDLVLKQGAKSRIRCDNICLFLNGADTSIKKKRKAKSLPHRKPSSVKHSHRDATQK